VVSLKNASASDAHERKARQIIKEEYPGFYLGSVRVFLSSDVSDPPGDYYRTTSALIDAYVHDILVKYLYKAEDDLRKNAYMHPLMICNSRGGAARVAMTKAIDTYNSGPVAGMCVAQNLGRLYGFDNVVTTDIGGTSQDVGLVRDGGYIYESLPRISGVAVNIPMIDVRSVGLAGGSIISLDGSNFIKVGPRSAGARPGPACFNLGGRMKLVRGKAETAIQNRIAKKLNVGWSPLEGYRKTPIYDRDLLEPGNLIKGPAVIEARDTTYVIPADWVLNIDKYSNAILEEV
jgi:N-methylhydantoinase A